MFRQKNPVSANAVRELMNLIEWPLPFGSPGDFAVDSLLREIVTNKHIQPAIPDQQSLVYRANVSPTRVTFHGPELEPYNRILRKFPGHHESFLRVSFCIENGQMLYFNRRHDYDLIFNRFRTIMQQGIQIAGRTYTFLGFSHSSLRGHAVWFSAPFIDSDGHLQTSSSIIKALGNFAKFTSPARCAATIGQAFSETAHVLPLRDNRILVETIPDVRSAHRVFSDGVGTILQEVVDRIWASIPHKKGTPSCFQVRLGGAKGMLALDSTIHGSIIRMRPSMIKFDTDDMGDLGICNMASQPYPLVLNRQLIKILEDMRVPNHWFFQLQNRRLKELRLITGSRDRTANFLMERKIAEALSLHKLIRHCYWLRLDYTQDPFLRSVVEAAVLRELRLLKHKARIRVRRGMTLYGIMDETGTLQENEVYVTFDTMNGRYAPPPGAGPLLVSRSPALHDGDVQVAQNTIPPAGHPLSHHRNCIVFSQNGQRDLPSMLSRGDLDGDLYHVIWDPIIVGRVQTYESASYPHVAPVDIGRPVTVDDMAGFFVDFMQTDRLGMIATSHMVLADRYNEGTKHVDCRKLAELHSTAVDYSKTGVPVDLGRMPRVGRIRTDFMAPGPQMQIYSHSKVMFTELTSHAAFDDDDYNEFRFVYYRSEKILGKLYRAINEKEIWNECIQTSTTPNAAGFWNQFTSDLSEAYPTLQLSKWEHRMDEAWKIRFAYEDALVFAMNNYSEHPTKPISELEVVIGIILTTSGTHTRRQRDRSVKLKDEFDRIAEWIMGDMRHGGLELCLACIHTGGYQRDEASRRRVEYRELRSFAVVAACALLMELASGNKSMNVVEVDVMQEYLYRACQLT
ncbi:hypothetical protein FE257_005740 [Aspergillus nanangensis]|uniref:RNA-dependent RNA polymerase n=1 Tax=Aspergillus nanangensis TaxID=2582783 RepID=A0AAD4GUH0_ASPNN|nr:hypothetical protein FE257_005740 [Aspergillus nanangensis]